MNGKTLNWAIRLTSVLVLTLATGALAQEQIPERLSGLINDYGPSTVSGGPYEMRGKWSLHVHQDLGTADFSAFLNMETSDYGIFSAAMVDPTNPATRNAHTHHFTMTGAITYDTSICPPNSPATNATGIVVTGPVSVTANGTPAPFQKKGPSTLQVCITGGAQVEFSNVTLQLVGPATGHFGTQAIHGVVRNKRFEDEQ